MSGVSGNRERVTGNDSTASEKSLRWKLVVAFAIIYLVWGSTYLAIRLAIDSIPPLLMAGARFLIAGGLLWAWCEWRREERSNRVQTINAALVGLAMVAVGNGLVTLAETSVPSGLTALIVAVGPAMTVLLLWTRRDRVKPTAATLAGLAFGLGGVGLLVFGSSSGRVDPLGAAMIVMATLGWSWGALRAQSSPMPVSSLRANAVQMLAGGTFVFLSGLVTGESSRFHPERITASSLWALGYLILFGSLAAYTAYNWLLRHVSATAAGTSAYVNPAVAVGLGALWGEPIVPRAIGAMVLIILGVYLLKRESHVPKPAPCPAAKPCEA